MELLNGKKTGGIGFTWIRLAALGLILSIAIQVGRCEVEPTESQCRPYIEKALKEQHTVDGEKSDEEWKSLIDHSSQEENFPTDETTETIEDSVTEENEVLKEEESPAEEGDSEAKDDRTEEETEDVEIKDNVESTEQYKEVIDGGEEEEVKEQGEQEQEEGEESAQSKEEEKEEEGEMSQEEAKEENVEESEDEQSEVEEEGEEREGGEDEDKETTVDTEESQEGVTEETGEEEAKQEAEEEKEEVEKEETGELEAEEEKEESEKEEEKQEGEQEEEKQEEKDEEKEEDKEEVENESQEGESVTEQGDEPTAEESTVEAQAEESSDAGQSAEAEGEVEEEKETDEDIIVKAMEEMVGSQVKSMLEKAEGSEGVSDSDKEKPEGEADEGKETDESTASQEDIKSTEEQEMTPEEDLTKEVIIPDNLRPRDHITQILRLDEESVQTESILARAVDSTLKSLKGLYDNAIKPLEMLYKYRDLSNRHFGDPEIFSKPLILFMGPWSGGKSTTINYLLDNEFNEMSLRTGAEPSPAYFNIMMYGSEEEVLDGTQLAADWTFSGLQKFGQGLLDRLKGYKLPNRLLEKVNIVEIPGILEIRKQVQRLFPFNDACQWFIDRADIIFLVYDPSKLDVGPETEAILDQLKGREYQTRIILNKADQVKPEELMRVQGTLIWNISPLMSSTEPPVMYTTSLWSLPYESGAPTRLLLAQERAFLRDLRDAIDKRVENKIASARRFAVRVRNHAKMVDCYLTTYYNHKTFFGNKKKISDDIIENPQKYHIYEGLSTLTNISRYDLPDPDVYRDFFKLNSLYDFKKLSDTCTYFRGCPINTLDVAIAYDLPELVGKYKKAVEASKGQTTPKTNS